MVSSEATWSWQQLTGSSQAAFERAFGARANALPTTAESTSSASAPFVSTSTLLLGIARTHAGPNEDNPLRDLLHHQGRSVRDLEIMLRSRMEDHTPFDLEAEQTPLHDFPELTPNVRIVLDQAARLAANVPSPPARIPLRFLIGGLLMTDGSRAWNTLAMTLGTGANLSAVADSYPTFLAEGPATRFSEFLQDRSTRWFAGYRADSATGEDLLGRRSRVELVARWLSAKNLDTPLAIGLFGDWGSGKSFFMRQLMKHINELTSKAGKMTEPAKTSYCTHIAQVNFNAWLHSDTEEIWPSLAAQVFRAVSGAETDGVPVDGASLEELRTFWSKQNTGYRKATERLEAAEQAVKEAETDERHVGEQADAKRQEVTKGIKGLANVIGLEEEDTTGIEDGPALTQGLTRAGLLSWWKNLQPGSRAGLVVASIVLVVGVVALLVLPTFLAAAATVLGLVGGSLTAIRAGVVPAISSIRKAHDSVRQAQEAQRDLRRLEDEAKNAGERKQEALTERAHAEEELAQRSQLGITSAYATGQAEVWAGREHLGTVSELRRAFDQLSSIIDQSRRQRQPGAAANRQDQAPIDRIIVYIDDLDRCQPDLVVRVLEAVKLLMDLPNFVVIIGVDSRWLFRSLEIRFQELVSGGGNAADEGGKGEWAATPQNYLEKIFQFSLRLPRMTPEGYSALIRGMFEPLEAEQAFTEEPPPTPVDGSSRRRDDDLPRTPRPEVDESESQLSGIGSGGDLVSTDLVLETEELDMLESLWPLIETPRSAKRLTNVYRLLRVTVGKEALLADETYARVLILLGIVVGFPRQSVPVFHALAAKPPDTAWDAFVELLKPEPQESRNGLVGEIAEIDVGAWARMHRELAKLTPKMGSEQRLGALRGWAEIVADYTFHPWRSVDSDTQGDVAHTP